MYMKSITVTVTNRPDYLEKLLKTLSEVKSIQEWDLFFSIEPNSDESINLIKGFNFKNKEIILRKNRLGILNHPYSILSEVFEHSDLNLYIEEDVIVSPDVLHLSEFFSRVSDNHVLINFFNKSNLKSERDEDLFVGFDEFVDGKNLYFSPFSWATTKYNWDMYISKWWYVDTRGWDFSIVESLFKLKKSIIFPGKCRSNHIGEYGTNVTPYYNQLYHSNVVLSNNKNKIDYEIVNSSTINRLNPYG